MMGTIKKSLIIFLTLLFIGVVIAYTMTFDVKNAVLPKLTKVLKNKNLDLLVAGPIKVGLTFPCNPVIVVSKLEVKDAKNKYGVAKLKVDEIKLKLSLIKAMTMQNYIAVNNIDMKNIKIYTKEKATNEPTFKLKAVTIDGIDSKNSEIIVKGNIAKLPFKLTGEVVHFAEQVSFKPHLKLGENSNVSGTISVSGISRAYNLKVNLTSDDMHYGEIISTLHGSKLISGATGKLMIRLNSDAPKLQQLHNNLHGKILVDAGSGIIAKNIEKYTDGLFETLADNVIPFEKSSNSSKFSCAVINMDVKQSIAQLANTLAIETQYVNIIGKGTVNLLDGKLDLAVKPVKKVGKVFDGIKLAEMAKVTGTIYKPKIGISSEGLIKSGASLAAAIISGGSSVAIESIFDPSTESGSPCKTAREWRME